MKILCIGSSILEKTCVINELVVENKKYRIENVVENGGGHAGNIAYLLGKWGVEVYIASMLGADDGASKIKKEYENIGVKTDFLETSYDRNTGEELVIVNETNKNKTVFELANNATLKKYAFNFAPDILVIDGNDYSASMNALDKYPKSNSFLVVSKSNNDINELGKFVKNIIFNRETAEEITNIKVDYEDTNTLVSLYNKLKQKYPNAEIVVTLGERGCIYAISGQIKIMPPVVVSIVDTNGAGDAFAGAYIYGIGRNFGLEKSLAYACISASLSTTKLTSRQAIPTLTEVSNYYDSKFGAQNNPNTAVSQNGEQNSNPNAKENGKAKIEEHTTLQTSENNGSSPINSNTINNAVNNNDNSKNA